MNVMGIIFANDATLGALTANRTMASLPFGGRYRQVDFALSNLAGAGVRHVGIVTRHHYQSLINHVGSGEEWGLELEEGGLEYLTPYATSKTDNYRGKLESLHSAMTFLQTGPEDELVVMIDSAILSNVDLNQILTSHIQSGRDIIIVTKAVFQMHIVVNRSKNIFFCNVFWNQIMNVSLNCSFEIIFVVIFFQNFFKNRVIY